MCCINLSFPLIFIIQQPLTIANYVRMILRVQFSDRLRALNKNLDYKYLMGSSLQQTYVINVCYSIQYHIKFLRYVYNRGFCVKTGGYVPQKLSAIPTKTFVIIMFVDDLIRWLKNHMLYKTSMTYVCHGSGTIFNKSLGYPLIMRTTIILPVICAHRMYNSKQY